MLYVRVFTRPEGLKLVINCSLFLEEHSLPKDIEFGQKDLMSIIMEIYTRQSDTRINFTLLGNISKRLIKEKKIYL